MQGSQTLGKTKKPKTTGQRLSAGNIEVKHVILFTSPLSKKFSKYDSRIVELFIERHILNNL